ncbi:hypothetical protein RFI_34106, partial [Reticulomyxa filosa]
FNHNGKLVYYGKEHGVEEGEYLVVDETIFHPQGGGQPSDKGTITITQGSKENETVFVVTKVMEGSDHIIRHYGYFSPTCAVTEASLEKDVPVLLEIDSLKRERFAKLHSAGHLIDCVVNTFCRDLNLIPSKGYHFENGAYVEYIGDIPDVDQKVKFVKQINDTLAEWIQQKTLAADIINFNARDYTQQVLQLDEQKDPQKWQETIQKLGGEAAQVRVIGWHCQENEKKLSQLWQEKGGNMCMCGGTHVDNVGRFKKIAVTKLKKKQQNLRVSYVVE